MWHCYVYFIFNNKHRFKCAMLFVSIEEMTNDYPIDKIYIIKKIVAYFLFVCWN
jgi:hypothetical protein